MRVNYILDVHHDSSANNNQTHVNYDLVGDLLTWSSIGYGLVCV
jgi:hypothetical protein